MENDIKNKDNLEIDEDLRNEDDLILKVVPGPSLNNLSCAF